MRILGRRARAQTADALGRVAVPRETLDGFKIQIAAGKLTIGRGRIYVDGLLAENHGREPVSSTGACGARRRCDRVWSEP